MPLLWLLTPRTLFWAAILALAVALGWQTVRLADARADLSSEIASREKDRADAQEQLRLAERRVASRVQEAAAEQQRLSDAFANEKADLAARLADAAADADGLRADIAAFVGSARPVGPDATPAAPAAVDRGHQASTLGQLFGACVGRYQSVAQDADRHAAEVRALKRQIAADRMACTTEQGATNGEANR